MRGIAPPTPEYFARVVAVARWIFGADMNVQVPPNLSDDFGVYLDAGINDWGGVSPLTIDWVNPEAPWPHLDRLRSVTEAAGFELRQRMPVYPEYLTPEWIDRGLLPGLVSAVDDQGYAVVEEKSDHMTDITFVRLRPAEDGPGPLGRSQAARRGDRGRGRTSDGRRTATPRSTAGLLPIGGETDLRRSPRPTSRHRRVHSNVPSMASEVGRSRSPAPVTVRHPSTPWPGPERRSTASVAAPSSMPRRSPALPGIDARVSVFVDTIEEAIEAIEPWSDAILCCADGTPKRIGCTP